MEKVHFICQTILSPSDSGHVILLGCPHPELFVRLAALHCSFNISSTTPTHSLSACPPRPFSLSQFLSRLATVCTTADVSNERVLLLLTDKDLAHESWLSSVYRMVKDCAISSLFSKEDRVMIVNGVRGDLAVEGQSYSENRAWEFFLR